MIFPTATIRCIAKTENLSTRQFHTPFNGWWMDKTYAGFRAKDTKSYYFQIDSSQHPCQRACEDTICVPFPFRVCRSVIASSNKLWILACMWPNPWRWHRAEWVAYYSSAEQRRASQPGSQHLRNPKARHSESLCPNANTLWGRAIPQR